MGGYLVGFLSLSLTFNHLHGHVSGGWGASVHGVMLFVCCARAFVSWIVPTYLC